MGAAPQQISPTDRVAEFRRSFARAESEISKIIVGHRDVIRKLLAALMAGGHVLIEGVPGLGKTLMVKTAAEALGLSFKRIQFTPDLMPSDIIGTQVLTETDGRREFSFKAGPIFAHVVLGDEINRATPKTQSAVLEAMEERQVTVFGETYLLEPPFFVLATQNPIELEGTYPLPEAQMDRFLFKVVMGSPKPDELREILHRTTGATVYHPQPTFDPRQAATQIEELKTSMRMRVPPRFEWRRRGLTTSSPSHDKTGRRNKHRNWTASCRRKSVVGSPPNLYGVSRIASVDAGQ